MGDRQLSPGPIPAHRTGDEASHGAQGPLELVEPLCIDDVTRSGKAGIPESDSRGALTSNRARTTIATQLLNAKEPVTLADVPTPACPPRSNWHYTQISHPLLRCPSAPPTPREHRRDEAACERR
jgi:hypothetical protein